MPKRRVTPEELELWRNVAQTVRPIKSKRRAALPKEEAPGAPAPKAKTAKPATPAPPPPKPKPAPSAKPHELAHGLSHGIDRRQAERFRKGKLPIEGKIDLHGRTQQDAHDDLLAFLRRAHAAGKRTVLVVTGKGMTTSKTGILRQAVPRWLNEPAFRSLVLAFDYAEPQHGGEGALYVLLKRVREK
ncbi:Smr/MutS family protein [Dongia deserti]|uniref:Smr/MutS family protein n=1 Tax=Dongia deserti TaxID=2268030 RepID=UPI000E658E95|nr:Smr/MutS family protein [Dongia deserti]